MALSSSLSVLLSVTFKLYMIILFSSLLKIHPLSLYTITTAAPGLQALRFNLHRRGTNLMMSAGVSIKPHTGTENRPLLPPEKVIIVGSSNQDLTSYSNVIPKLGQTVLGERFEISAGGKGANQAVAAAKLLPTKKDNVVHFITRVGNDPFARLVLQNLDDSNVKYNPDSITCNDSHTGVAPIVVDQNTGDNMIIVIPGANKLLTSEMVRQELASIKHEIKDFSRVVILSQLEVPIQSALEAMRIGKEEWGDAITILNPAPCDVSTLNNQLLKHVDILIPNETELQQLVDHILVNRSNGTKKDAANIACSNINSKRMTEEEMAKILLNQCDIQRAVVVTLGARGAIIVSRSNTSTSDDENDYQITMVNSPTELECNNLPVVDTVGAGDAFCGSLSIYLSSGMPLNEAATKACGVASMSVRKLGAQTSYPSASDLPTILRLDGFSHDYEASISNIPATASPKRKLTFVTGNKKKLEEVQQLLLSSGGDSELPFDITNQKIDLPELQGDPIDIAREKCSVAAKEINGPVFTEDTSLCFNALNSLPGPYIKWFLEKCGHDGLNKMLVGFDDKTAYAQTIIAFTWGPGQDIHVFDGRTNGCIVGPRGSLDFGWDPIFQPNEGNGLTYAEMTKEAKNLISHRGRSFMKFREFLMSHQTNII